MTGRIIHLDTDEALADLLGRKAREAVYDYLARERSISRSDLPTRLDDLTSLLESIFGKGSKTIERSVVRKLYKALGWEFADVSSYRLQDYLTLTRQRVGKEWSHDSMCEKSPRM